MQICEQNLALFLLCQVDLKFVRHVLSRVSRRSIAEQALGIWRFRIRKCADHSLDSDCFPQLRRWFRKPRGPRSHRPYLVYCPHHEWNWYVSSIYSPDWLNIKWMLLHQSHLSRKYSMLTASKSYRKPRHRQQSLSSYELRLHIAPLAVSHARCLQLAFVQLGGAIATGIESKKAVFTSRFLRRTSLITTGVGL